MKKVILIFTLLITTLTYSQKFGFHFGVNLSTHLDKDRVQNNSKELDYKNVFGINIGIDYKKEISNNLFLLSGLNFTQNGFEHDELIVNGGKYVAKSAKLNYLQIPIVLSLDSRKTKIGPNLKLGGYFSYLVGGKYTISNFPFEKPLDEEFQRFDYGLTGGIRIKLNKFTLDFIYNLGLNNIAEDGDNTFLQTIIRNRSFNVNLIYWIK